MVAEVYLVVFLVFVAVAALFWALAGRQIVNRWRAETRIEEGERKAHELEVRNRKAAEREVDLTLQELNTVTDEENKEEK